MIKDRLTDEEIIRLTAQTMVKAHNGSAALMCAENAERWRRRGDQSAEALWLRILQAVRELEYEMVRR